MVVNDRGGSVDGSGSSSGPAQEVVDEITQAGGTAVANTDDIADWDGARRLVDQAVAAYGRLDVLVNNAGILRDRTLVKMTEEEWDSVIRVHLKGTAAMSHWAAVHWTERHRAGDEVDGRVVNTTSSSGIYGNFGQANYGAAKAGIAALTIIAALEFERFGATVNAVSPGAYTRMTEGLSGVFGIKQPTRGAARPDVAAVDRADRGLAGQPRIGRRHGPGVPGVGSIPRDRRGVGAGPGRRPGRRSRGGGARGGVAAGAGRPADRLRQPSPAANPGRTANVTHVAPLSGARCVEIGWAGQNRRRVADSMPRSSS